MQIKKVLGGYLKNNVFLSDIAYGCYSYKAEKALMKNIEYLTNIDSLESIEEIKAFRKQCADGTAVYSSKNRNRSNARIYGIKSSIFNGIHDKDYFFPTVEHGLILYDFVDVHVEETMRPTIVTFGDFRRQIIRKKLPFPVFCVGPYIHYASEYYDQSTMQEKKKKLGRNLLVFPQHSTDSATLSEDDKIFIARIEKEARDFDTVTVSAFWWNINDALIQKLAANGYHIVCNGFREDPQFLSRQKACIELCNRVIGDGIGTHVGYCVHLRKPYTYFNSGIEIKTKDAHEKDHWDAMQSNVDQIKNAFEGKEITPKQMEICAKYWGEGEEKSAEEIKAIYTINKDLTLLSKGSKSKYDAVTKEYINGLDVKSIKYKLLVSAIK